MKVKKRNRCQTSKIFYLTYFSRKIISLKMLLRMTFAFAILCAAFAVPDLKNPEDEEGIKISLEKLKFIPAELLCTLCHNVVNRLQHDLLEDPVKFQVNMLKSCDNYPELEDQVKCHSAFRNRQKIEQLLQPDAATKMCRAKKLCQEGELPLPPQAFPMMGSRPMPRDMRPIPNVESPLKPLAEPAPVVPAASETDSE
uniref:Saposin B-type domain-containing protein n=1 Tax=Panagrolaimus sp. JU765 TaxID=591449 RepID=A0AC34Q972_9BILA